MSLRRACRSGRVVLALVLVLSLFLGWAVGYAPTRAQSADGEDAAFLPKASLIALSESGAERVRIEGRAGSVPGSSTVVAVNLETGEIASGRSQADGRFSLTTPGVAQTPFELYATTAEPAFRTAQQDFKGLGTLVYNGEPSPRADGSASFVTSGRINRTSGRFVVQGTLNNTALPRGGRPALEAELTVRSPAVNASLFSSPFWVQAVLVLAPVSDAQGNPVFMPFDHVGYSPLLAPTGLGIKGVSGLIRPGYTDVPSSQIARDGNALSTEFTVEADPAFRLPEGTYAVGLELFIGRSRSSMESLLDNSLLQAPAPQGFLGEVAFPAWTGATVQVGNPSSARLPWALLWNTVSDGSRGAVAQEDQSHFSLRNKVVFDAEYFVVPRMDERTGEPIAYRLEPFLPTLFQNNKANIHPPVVRLKLPSGQLNVTVEKPDGTVEDLGSAPFRQYRLGELSESYPSFRYGETSVMTPLELTTLDPRFEYVFKQYGRHVITMRGAVEDAYGHSYEGGGIYEVWVAKPLNVVELGTFLGTPFEVGDVYSPTVRVEPGVPAEVEIDFRLHVNSSPTDVVTHTFSGRANRYGYFHPEAGGDALEIPAPGEYVVDVSARYWAPDGTLWMGSRRGANVVETPNGQLVAHGRRGMDRVKLPNRPQWFFYDDFADLFARIGASTPDFTFPAPFQSGDVVWAADLMFDRRGNGEIAPVVRIQDLAGDIAADITRRMAGYEDGLDGTIQELAAGGEIPLFTPMPITPGNPVPDRSDVRHWGYFYHVTMRPGVGVRAILSADDHGGIGKYWTFGDPYNLQPGSGPNGDLPGDIKLMFGGAVYRDLERGIHEYAIHGSMAVIVDNDDPLGERTAPPFRGAGGGPDGGPLLTLRGEEIDLFVTPTGVRPGEVLEVGDTFSFAGQFWPLLPSKLSVTVTSPSGRARQFEGQANKIGYVYDPMNDFVVDEPGRWSVTVDGFHDGLTSAGPVSPPFPRGDVLGADGGTYAFYVLPRDASEPTLQTTFVQPALSPLTLTGELPDDFEGAKAHYTLTMPGFILEQGSLETRNGRFSYTYDPVVLQRDFPNIDIRDQGNEGATAQSVDTITLTVLFESDGELAVRRALLQGEALIQESDVALSFQPPLENLARGKTVRASRSLAENPPELAVDGNFENWWGAGAGAPQWIEIDLGAMATVEEFRLAVSQFPEGRTTHRLGVKSELAGAYRTVHQFRGVTQDNQVLTHRPEVPLENVRFVRIDTTESPSWVSWREIVVIGRPGERSDAASEAGAPLGADSDGDGVPDAEDLCPTFPGRPEADGC